ncbi:hypothetical protein [Fenollaria sporofastidiosus]|uniref:hypothetical protein n=1 Tax=Fenollaria sporofastidiosus TaxID=2811778 RepID=UPI001C004E95|nr:hypothetical protein [Fenollaria sporofastidiosus]
MKKISKSIIIFMLMAVLLLSSCQKTSDKKETSDTRETSAKTQDHKDDDAKTEDKKDDDADAEKTISKNKETLKYVKGAIYGSASSYVEDREIWTGFVDEKHIEFVSGDGRGMHLPRILLDTDDAKKANKDIDKIEKEIKGLYNRCKKEITDEEVGIYAAFSVYQDEDVLSLMVESYNFWESKNTSYYVYNFSLPDGKYITDAELMKHFGVEEDEILGLIESSLKDEHELENKLYYMNVCDSSILNTPRSYTGVALNNLWDNFDPDAHHIYIDEVGEPHYIFKKVEFDSPLIADLKLKSNKLSENPISPAYIKMARKLGIDISDDKYKALIINLGAAFDEKSLKKTLQKLDPWENDFNNFEEPSMLLTVKYDDQDENPYLNGQECYLVVPKYKYASVALKELEISGGGKLKEKDNDYMDYIATAGPTFVLQNISEIAPNAKIVIKYRDDIFEFSPTISLNDGSMILPDEIYDAEDVLDWKNLIVEEAYSINFFEILKSMMPKG